MRERTVNLSTQTMEVCAEEFGALGPSKADSVWLLVRGLDHRRGLIVWIVQSHLRSCDECSRQFSAFIVGSLSSMPFRYWRIDGKIDRKFRAKADLTGDFEIASMFLNDLMRNGQAKPCPLSLPALMFRGVKGIENMVEISRLDPRSGIFHFNLNPGVMDRSD